MSMVLDSPFTKNIDGEQLTKEELTNKYKNLVQSIANKHKKRAKLVGMEIEDLVSEGNIGLIKAYNGFKSELGYRFMTYSYQMIEGEIRRRIRDTNEGPKFVRSIKDLANKVDFNCKPHEIAEALDINIQVSMEVWAFKHIAGEISMDATIFQSDGEDITIQECIPNYEDYSTVFVSEFLQLLENHKPRYAKVLRYLLEGKNQGEIGEIIGRSQVQVSRNISDIRYLYKAYLKEVV